MISLEKKEPL